MLVANANDKPRVIEILTAAFIDNKSVGYLVPQDGLKLYRVHRLMEYAYQMCKLFGEVFISEEGKACALVLFPELRKTTLKSVILDLRLVCEAIGVSNVFRAMRREKLIKARQVPEPMGYLWFIGVDPSSQGLGLGGKMLSEVVSYCAKENRPVYLETSTMDNLPFYKKYGFEVYATLELSYKLYFLRRPLG